MFSCEEAKVRYHQPLVDFVFKIIGEAIDNQKYDCVVAVNEKQSSFIKNLLESDQYKYTVTYGAFDPKENTQALIISGWIEHTKPDYNF